ncbi:hypothetical protein ACFL35_21070, partial [Candidatus Riflebacteria bacterium]
MTDEKTVQVYEIYAKPFANRGRIILALLSFLGGFYLLRNIGECAGFERVLAILAIIYCVYFVLLTIKIEIFRPPYLIISDEGLSFIFQFLHPPYTITWKEITKINVGNTSELTLTATKLVRTFFDAGHGYNGKYYYLLVDLTNEGIEKYNAVFFGYPLFMLRHRNTFMFNPNVWEETSVFQFKEACLSCGCPEEIWYF